MQRLTPQYSGIGIRIENCICAIDIDHCIDEYGNPTPEAKDVIDSMGCYTEVSPSGRGYRLLFSVRPNFHFDPNLYYINNQKIGLEVYIAGATSKYVTVTGNTITPGVDLLDRTDQLQYVLDTYMRRPTPAPQIVPQAAAAAPQPNSQPTALLPADHQLISAIRTSNSAKLFDSLFTGNLDNYGGDHSAADLAMANILGTYTQDANQIDRIFRHSGLMRHKWDEMRGAQTYGQMTIAKALASAPRRSQPSPAPAAQQTAPAAQSPSTPYPLISASDLMRKPLADIRFHVAGLIPEGTTLLAASPKIGKSLYATALCLAVTTGCPFLGRPTTPGEVLYISLEDGEKRLQKRIGAILNGKSPPDGLFLATDIPDIHNGFFDTIDGYLEQHPNIRLIIIDTLQLIRGVENNGNYSYSTDYQDLATIKKYGEKHSVSFLLIHHTRKAADGDAFSTVSGSNGLSGAVDTVALISRQRNAAEATLSITGRDVVEQELSIVFDKPTLQWVNLGDARVLREQRERTSFLNEPIVRVVCSILQNSGIKKWSGSAADLAAEGQKLNQDLGKPQHIGMYLANVVDKFEKYTNIVYLAHPNGTAGKTHTFALAPAANTEPNNPTAGDNPVG